MVLPKKSLGQHFLKDQNIARKIVDSLDEEVKGGVLEIGPGTGVLSGYLFEKYPDVHLIEVDEEGTEAAAATIVEIVETSAGIDPKPTFIIDKPFAFFIREKHSEAIIFSGKLVDPR